VPSEWEWGSCPSGFAGEFLFDGAHQLVVGWRFAKVLLELDVLVHRDEHIKAFRGTLQERTILERRPPQFVRRTDLMPCDQATPAWPDFRDFACRFCPRF